VSNINVYRDHELVPVRRHPVREFKRGKIWPRIESDRIVGLHLTSNNIGKELRTTLVALNFNNDDRNDVLCTVESATPIVPVLQYLHALYGEHDKPGNTKERNVRVRDNLPRAKGQYRDGRRKLPQPIILICHDLEAALGRLVRNNSQFKRTIQAGDSSMKFAVEGGGEIEIMKIAPGGTGCGFELLYREGGSIIRVIGRSLAGYLKESSQDNAEAFLADDDPVPIPDSWDKRRWDSFSGDEVALLKSHVAHDARTARQLHEHLVNTLLAISPKVIRRDGTLPPSVAGAGIKIAWSMSEMDSWSAPSDRVTQVGALTLAGGRYIMHVKPGYYEGLNFYDGKSWHGYLMSLLPDPATCEYVDVKPGPFNVMQWIGQYGAMCVSGVANDNVNPPLREHDVVNRRLHYIKGSFIRVWASIPEIVVGVVSGRLTITHIHDGVHIVGSPEY